TRVAIALRMQTTHARRRSRRGMTLIEVMIVIVILGLISGGIAVAVFKRHHDAQLRLTHIGAAELRRAASTWRSEHPGGECPTPKTLRADGTLDPGSKLTDAW